MIEAFQDCQNGTRAVLFMHQAFATKNRFCTSYSLYTIDRLLSLVNNSYAHLASSGMDVKETDHRLGPTEFSHI